MAESKDIACKKALYEILSKVYWREPLSDIEQRFKELNPWHSEMGISEAQSFRELSAAAVALNRVKIGFYPTEVFGEGEPAWHRMSLADKMVNQKVSQLEKELGIVHNCQSGNLRNLPE